MTATLTRRFIVCLTGIAVISFASSALYSQQLTQYSHTAWRVQDGVFDAAPVSIAQTTDGFLWIGTLNGLIRFDGVHFESWNERIQELHTCCAWSLLGSRDGSLWIGTSVGLAKLQGAHLSIVRNHDPLYNSIIEDGKGGVWAARTRIRDNKGSLCEIEGTQLQCHGEHKGLSCQYGNVMAKDQRGTMWLGGVGEVCSWRDGAAAKYSAPANDEACKPSIQSLLPDFDGSLLIGCEGGLRRLQQGKVVPFQAASLDADKLAGAKLLYDRSGGLWIGTTNDGLWTPVAGTLAALVEVWKILTVPGDRWIWLLLATVSGALAMLGPGLWSVDARLFGWKRVEAPPRKGSSSPS